MDYKLIRINNKYHLVEVEKPLLDGEIEVYNTIKTFDDLPQFFEFFYSVKVVVNNIERKSEILNG